MKFELRPWTENDLQSLVRYANNFEIAKNLSNRFPYPYSEEAGRSFIKMVNEINPPEALAISLLPKGEVIGSIGVHPQADVYQKNAELGYWVAEPFWGQGIATEAIKWILDYAFDKYDITRVFARVFGRNVASQRVLEKVGFQLEGKFAQTLFKNGQYEDELIYAIRRELT